MLPIWLPHPDSRPITGLRRRAPIAVLLAAVMAAATLVLTSGPGAAPAANVLVGAGDIGSCTSRGDKATAKLLDDIPGTVFTLGDNAYMDGSAAQFRRCYTPYWGRHRARTRPVLGNHDLRTDGGSPYYDYFGTLAGSRGEGWYSYRVNGWQVVVLNSACDAVGCAADSPQGRWLRQTLQEPARCTVAMWHHPLFTSGGKHAAEQRIRPLYDMLNAHGAEIVLTAHNHNYERFAPQNGAGERDDATGIREFVVGTGGASLYRFAGPAAPNSEIRTDDTYGVLKLTLGESGYEWEFVAPPGSTFTDTGTGTCH
ncbi:metallophosphoesterase family protein [Catellatospora methionotrophica]|uniref:metallophosphoesterase family protein n=1 Tax=Catellatospora methionotrophica TaxID=121620 RepID=UPI003403FAE0